MWFYRAKIFHFTITALVFYGLVKAFYKRKYIRGLIFWSPLFFLLFSLRSNAIYKLKYVSRIYLRSNGTHIDIACKPIWDSISNFPISDINTFEKEELSKLISKDDMLLAKFKILPL